MWAEYQRQLAMSEIKGYTKVRFEGRTIANQRGKTLWFKSMVGTTDLFIPISLTKGQVFGKEDHGQLGYTELYVADWFVEKHRDKFESIGKIKL